MANFLEEMQMNRDLNDGPVTLRAFTREAGDEHYPIPAHFGAGPFGHHYIDEFP